MSKLLKMIGITFFMVTIFSCTEPPVSSSDDSTKSGGNVILTKLIQYTKQPKAPVIWGADIGDTFRVFRVYDPTDETLTFDFANLEINDDLLVNLDAKYFAAGDDALISALILIDNDVAKWTVSDNTPDVINRANVEENVYSQIFNQSENPALEFSNATQTFTVRITITDSKYIYVLEGTGGDEADVTVVNISLL